jgi:hypothetical protein
VKLPDWNDDDGLMELVGIELEKLPRPPVRDETVEQWCREVELNAIEVAKAGNFRPLVTVRGWRKYGYELSAEAEALIDQRLLGKRRVKEGRGRVQRRETPTFCAARDVPLIQGILKRHFTGRRPYMVRAQELAAKQWGVEVDTLINFMKKGRHF